MRVFPSIEISFLWHPSYSCYNKKYVSTMSVWYSFYPCVMSYMNGNACSRAKMSSMNEYLKSFIEASWRPGNLQEWVNWDQWGAEQLFQHKSTVDGFDKSRPTLG